MKYHIIISPTPKTICLLSTPIVTQSQFFPVVTLVRYAEAIKKHQRHGPKGYKAFRYVVTSDIIDHQKEVVDIHALAEVLPIMEKQGSRVQGLHSNYPAGEFFDWGFCKVSEKLSIWVDIEWYDDYPSQKELLEKIELPSGDPERMNALSLGGRSLETKRVCDQNRCWDHISKLEGWEISIVKEGANEYARQINEETNTLEGLNLPVEYFNKIMKPLEVKQMTKQDRNGKGRFISKEAESKPDESKPSKPDEGKDNAECTDCPDCPKCDGKMKGDKCEKCGYSKMEGEQEGEPNGEPNGEGKMEGYPEADSNGYSEDDNMEGIAAINQKMDTMMEALNIGKEDTGKLEKALEILALQVGTLVKERPPEEVIEKDGLKYRLVKEDDELNKASAESDNSKETDMWKIFTEELVGISKQVAILKTQTDEPISVDDTPQAEPLSEDEELNTDINKNFDIDAIIKTNTESIVKDSGLSAEEVEYMQRQDVSIDKTQMPLEDQDIFYQ